MRGENDMIQVIGGDFNVRTGFKEDLYTGEGNENTNKRVSKNKVLNLAGDQFLDLVEKKKQIENGNIVGNEVGEFTYGDNRAICWLTI